jgi:hypothetical protein
MCELAVDACITECASLRMVIVCTKSASVDACIIRATK